MDIHIYFRLFLQFLMKPFMNFAFRRLGVAEMGRNDNYASNGKTFFFNILFGNFHGI